MVKKKSTDMMKGKMMNKKQSVSAAQKSARAKFLQMIAAKKAKKVVKGKMSMSAKQMKAMKHGK